MNTYGEVEYWCALGKVILIVGLIFYTFITMVGGNPLKDRYGFRFWQDPGSFAEYIYEGDLGRFLGFLQCLIQASFTIAGPDYVSMAAGEAENPRAVMPRAFNAVFYRLTAFFVLGSLCVGINVPHDDPELTAAFANALPGAAASPYVVSMNRLRIQVLPDIVNALVLSAAFSAGNSYVYCASRSLFGLALEGKAPRVFTRCTRNGVPIYCVAFVLAISLLSFLQVSNNAAVVLQWFVSLVTASQLINFAVMCFTFLRFKAACEAQGLSRASLPYQGYLQPMAAWYGLVGTTVMAFVGGYAVFLPGRWDVPTFLFSYVTSMSVEPTRPELADIQSQLHHDRYLPSSLLRLEVHQEDKVARVARRGPLSGCRRDRRVHEKLRPQAIQVSFSSGLLHTVAFSLTPWRHNRNKFDEWFNRLSS